MDVYLFGHPEELLGAWVWLLLVGALGYVAARRRRGTLWVSLPLLAVLAWSAASGLIRPSRVPAQYRAEVWRDNAVTGAVALLALLLPVLGARRPRSRPAA